METKKFDLFVCFAAFGSALLSVGLYLGGKISAVYSFLYMPAEAVSNLVRWLSFRSAAGNMAAWLLYAGICLIPAGFVIVKRLRKGQCTPDNKKSKTERTDYILLMLSAYLFFMLYCFINPGILSVFIPDGIGTEWIDALPILKIILANMAYSLGIGYAVLKFAAGFQSIDIWRKTEHLLIFCTILYVAMTCFILPLNLFQEYGNVSSAGGQAAVLFQFFLKLLPTACLVGIMQSGVLLIHSLKENKYERGAAEIAILMASRSRKTVVVSVLCNIAQNVTQFILWRGTNHVNILMNIPFLPLILAFAGLLLAEYMKESSSLYDDNQMII